MKKISKSQQTLTRKGYGIQIGPNSQCFGGLKDKKAQPALALSLLEVTAKAGWILALQ
ncbi:MAG: hypothetical protein UW97_C0010G0008 [Parcubacteria group bacterium GW2011_GWA2_45_15]|nr:MAG: hypothetical protein UW97_C0010G0008 [Parcubacteria group bacterium GW2011_GWA2_45_15]